MKVSIVMILLAATQTALAGYIFGKGGDGATRCYPADNFGVVLAGSYPVENSKCWLGQKARYVFGKGGDGATRCYPADNEGNSLAGSMPVSNSLCWGNNEPDPTPVQQDEVVLGDANHSNNQAEIGFCYAITGGNLLKEMACPQARDINTCLFLPGCAWQPLK